jgi:penicillin-binding protein 2
LQLAVMTARIASGKNLQPSLIYGRPHAPGPDLPFTPEQLAVVHDGMFRVVNGSGTGGGVRIDLNGVKLAGKTGTAQVRALVSRGHVGDWKSRDHSLFICYAPTDKPLYAMAVVVEHGTFGARAAAPIARDVMTYLFDPTKAMDVLTTLEKQWGGTPSERMANRYRAFSAHYGTSAPKVEGDDAVKAAQEKAAEQSEALPADASLPHTEREEPVTVPSAAAAQDAPVSPASQASGQRAAAAPTPAATPVAGAR